MIARVRRSHPPPHLCVTHTLPYPILPLYHGLQTHMTRTIISQTTRTDQSFSESSIRGHTTPNNNTWSNNILEVETSNLCTMNQ